MLRLASFLAGILVLAALWIAPLGEILPGPFSRHMTMHMGVVAIAAPLLAAGIVQGRFDPVTRAPVLFAPILASVVELVVVWAWHAPALHHAASRSSGVFVLEQASFLASGLLLWLAVLGGNALEREARAASGILALLLTSMHMTLLGALLALPPRPLYVHAAHGPHDALDEQHLGGAIMLIVGGVVYLAGGLLLTVDLLRRRAIQPRGAS